MSLIICWPVLEPPSSQSRALLLDPPSVAFRTELAHAPWGFSVVSNPVGLTFSVALHGVPPQRLQLLWDRLVIDGFDSARVYANAGEFLVEAARIVDALDADTLHADYIFDPAEVIDR